MPRATADSTLVRIDATLKQNPGSLGGKLGRAIITANLPVDACAVLLGASLPTMYRWFFGETEPSPIFRKQIHKLMTIVMWGTAKELLPAVGTRAERIQQMTATVIKYRVERHDPKKLESERPKA